MNNPSQLVVGSKVVICAGTFESFLGKILKIDEIFRQARVAIDIFGRETAIDVPLEFLETNVAAYREKVQREASERRTLWTLQKCQELGIPKTAGQPEALFEFAGVYSGNHSSPWGGSIRLTFTPDGFFQRESHLDLGNVWSLHSSGYYLVYNSIAWIEIVKSLHSDSCDDYRLPDRLHLKLENGKRVVGSTRAMQRLTKLTEQSDEPISERMTSCTLRSKYLAFAR